MAKYISQLRRGRKETDADGNITRDDWADYEENQASNPDYMVPQDGELVLEYVNGVPRLKIGNGRDPFSALPYMSVDSFILPKQATVTITPSHWMRVDCDGKIIDSNGNVVGVDGNIAEENYYEIDEAGSIIDADGKLMNNRYVQFVDVINATITPNSKVDLQPSPSDLAVFHEKDITFTAINAGGQVRVCVVGQKPANEYTFNVTVTEVV